MYIHVKYYCGLTLAGSQTPQSHSHSHFSTPPLEGKRNSRKTRGSRQNCLADKGEVREDKKESSNAKAITHKLPQVGLCQFLTVQALFSNSCSISYKQPSALFSSQI